MSTPTGYYRVSDGQRMKAGDAWDLWAQHAHQILVRTARSYHAVITYGELAAEVQEGSGVRTAANQRNWIGKVLARVVRAAHDRSEPPLTALVVHAGDGMVGEGYKEVLEVAGQPPVEDSMQREEHAALARLECYRRFGAQLPPDGGVPALAPKLRAAVQRRRARNPAPPAVCPTCRVQLPGTGVCDECG